MVNKLNFKIQLVTIQSLLVFRLISLFFLFIFLFTLICSNSIQAKTNTKSQTYKNLMGLGINSIKEWTGCENVVKENKVVGSVNEYSQVLGDGWRHLNFIVCAEDHFPDDVLDEKWVRIKLEAIRGQIRELKKQFPDRTFTITFKGMSKLKKRRVDGSSITKLYHRIRLSKKMEAQYLKWWKLAAEIFRDEKSIVFWLMNEPDYRFDEGLEYYLELATKVVDEIRSVSPDRYIISNGISKSLVGRGASIFKIMKPINRDNIIYGFHFYGLKDSQWSRRPFVLENVISSISKEDKEIRKALNQITEFKKRFGVPTMLTEIGIVGKTKYVETGVDSKERARFFREVIIPWADKCECGLLYWALGDASTPYIRKDSQFNGSPEYKGDGDFQPPIGMPLARDELLFKALGLDDYFVFKKSKVKELQLILTDDGFNVGDIDGVLGKKTIKGMEAWYEKRKIQFNKKTSDRLEYLIALQYMKNLNTAGKTTSNITKTIKSYQSTSKDFDLNKIIVDVNNPDK